MVQRGPNHLMVPHRSFPALNCLLGTRSCSCGRTAISEAGRKALIYGEGKRAHAASQTGLVLLKGFTTAKMAIG